MSIHSWLQDLRSSLAPGRGQRNQRRRGSPRAASDRPSLEVLEVRLVLSTFTVTNLLDSGPDSLRAAVVSANANPGPDAIDFATTGTITLTSGELDITDSLTVGGPGVDALTVSGIGSPGLSNRVLHLSGNPTVLIANLTVANGWTASGNGGGISMAGGTLTLDHCTVAGNTSGTYVGGGIYVAGGALTLNQSTVSGNQAAVGGGIFMQGGTLTLNQSTVSGNQAESGGGIYVAGGTLALDQSNVSGNQAEGGYGGGVYMGGGALTLNQSTVSENSAASFSRSDYGGGGGGIYVVDGTLALDQSVVSGNSAEGSSYGYGAGGGLYVAGGTLTLTNSTVRGNIAIGSPGIDSFYGLYGGSGGRGWPLRHRRHGLCQPEQLRQ